MAESKVEVKDTGWEKLKKNLLKAAEKPAYTSVGVHEDAGSADNGMTLAKIAAIQEFGVHITVTDKMRGYLASQGLFLKKDTMEIVIPARSFLRGFVDEYKGVIEGLIEKLLDKLITGNTTVEGALKILGEFATGGVKARIVKGIDPELHPFTIEHKGSSKPLVDTGRLLGSISHREHYGGHE